MVNVLQIPIPFFPRYFTKLKAKPPKCAPRQFHVHANLPKICTIVMLGDKREPKDVQCTQRPMHAYAHTKLKVDEPCMHAYAHTAYHMRLPDGSGARTTMHEWPLATSYPSVLLPGRRGMDPTGATWLLV